MFIVGDRVFNLESDAHNYKIPVGSTGTIVMIGTSLIRIRMDTLYKNYRYYWFRKSDLIKI